MFPYPGTKSENAPLVRALNFMSISFLAHDILLRLVQTERLQDALPRRCPPPDEAAILHVCHRALSDSPLPCIYRRALVSGPSVDGNRRGQPHVPQERIGRHSYPCVRRTPHLHGAGQGHDGALPHVLRHEHFGDRVNISIFSQTRLSLNGFGAMLFVGKAGGEVAKVLRKWGGNSQEQKGRLLRSPWISARRHNLGSFCCDLRFGQQLNLAHATSVFRLVIHCRKIWKCGIGGQTMGTYIHSTLSTLVCWQLRHTNAKVQ